MIVTGGGKADRPGKIVFNATFTYLTDDILPNSYLYSYWEMDSPKDFDYFNKSIKRNDRILIDSGAHGIYQALIRQGFLSPRERQVNINTGKMQEYIGKYINFLHEYESVLWGYIELDLGDEKQKTELRQEFEKQGVYPIPVFHPINDSLEYLEYLCLHYDRLCFGNLATEPESVRSIVVSLASEAKKKYPYLWVHLLGMAPCPFFSAYPNIDSADSSSSSSLIRFGRFSEGSFFDLAFRVTDEFCNRRNDSSNYRLGAAIGYRSYNYHAKNWSYYWNNINAGF